MPLQSEHPVVLHLRLFKVDLSLTQLRVRLREIGLGLNDGGLALGNGCGVDRPGFVEIGSRGREIGLGDGNRAIGLDTCQVLL